MRVLGEGADVGPNSSSSRRYSAEERRVLERTVRSLTRRLMMKASSVISYDRNLLGIEMIAVAAAKAGALGLRYILVDYGDFDMIDLEEGRAYWYPMPEYINEFLEDWPWVPMARVALAIVDSNRQTAFILKKPWED